MSQLNNPLEIYKLLPKTNCRMCGMPTCMAFAAEVIKGEKRLEKCPHLASDIIKELDGKIIKRTSPEEQLKQVLEPLKQEITAIDLAAKAQQLGAGFSGGKLTVKCLGKDFTVDSQGNITSDCHINVWVTVPLLNYIINSAGNDLSSKWVPFRELKNGAMRNSLFEQRFEKPLKELTDKYPDLIEDMIGIFSGKQVETSFSFDISLVLFPLPKVPILICYTKPVEDIHSKLNVFFDSNAEDNLDVDSIYRLCVGLLMMFEKIASRHTK